MGFFKKTENHQDNLERAKRHGTDKRIYGDLIYRCRRCGYEGKIENVPNIDRVAYVLMNGNRDRIFMTTNYYQDPETNTIYQECMHHECEPGRVGYMELIGADIKGQIFLADKYKTQQIRQEEYNPNEEKSIDELFPEE